MPGFTQSDITNLFSHHPPQSDADIARYERIRTAGRQFATAILENTPGCAEQTIAIRKAHEAVMQANAAVACHGDPLTPPSS
jgi:hypothetical protein